MGRDITVSSFWSTNDLVRFVGDRTNPKSSYNYLDPTMGSRYSKAPLKTNDYHIDSTITQGATTRPTS